MKRSKKKVASRRDFIRTTGQIALASTLAGCVSPNKSAQRQTNKALANASLLHNTPANKELPTEKLGEIKPPTPSPLFQLKVRNPGWCPDTQSQGSVIFFPEEALRAEKGTGNLSHFPIPGSMPDPSKPQLDFVEPPPEFNGDPTQADFYTKREAWHDDWKQFNERLWGHTLKLPSNPTPEDQDFFDFLTELANQARRYNAALYWLRRLHFFQKGQGDDFPPFNPNGDEVIDPRVIPSQFPALVNKAEARWSLEIDRMNGLLNGESPLVKGFKHTKADMVEVNGYIVAMRVVSQKVPFVSPKELGGSSSSYISISSAFSSK